MVYNGRNIPVSLPGLILGIFGPASAAIIVSAVTNIEPIGRRDIKPYAAFFIFWIIFSFIHMARRTNLHDISTLTFTVNSIMGIPAAAVIAFAFSRIPSVRNTLVTLIRPRGKWYWYIAAAMVFPLLRLVGIALAPLAGEDVSFGDMPIHQAGIGSIIIYIAYKCMHNIIAEETGWRGFALPRLQNRYGPFIATAIVAVFWIIWHIPLHMAEAGDEYFAIIWPVYFDIFMGAFLLTWIFNGTGGRIIAAGIMHISFNLTYDYFPSTMAWHVLLTAASLAVCAAWTLNENKRYIE
jgi:membrane protease YdiL (CAAX protease family)